MLKALTEFNFHRKPADITSLPIIKQVSESVRYIVSNGEGITVGEFSYNRRWCFIIYGDKRIRFNIKRPLIGSNTVELVDDATGQVIGVYQKRRDWFRDMYWDGFSLYDKYYTFRREKPDIKYSLFKRSTWNRYKFSLTNEKEGFVYAFKIDLEAISAADYDKEAPFAGIASTDAGNLLPLLAGFFCVQEYLCERADNM